LDLSDREIIPAADFGYVLYIDYMLYKWHDPVIRRSSLHEV
jgi:hypothetical protein